MNDLPVLLGGEKILAKNDLSIFEWPQFDDREESAVLEIMRKPNFFDNTTVELFEKEFASWIGSKFALSQNSGTSALLTSMFACGVSRGDEIIVPSTTYWATVIPCFTLGATPVFADINPQSLGLDPNDIKTKISSRTKAIVVVHMFGFPNEMDEIRSIANEHDIKIIEDASHAHGSMYKGKRVGTLGDVAAFSLCGKPIAVGEGGIITTNSKEIWERCLAWSSNFRFNSQLVSDEALLKYSGLPMGGVTTRMHNLSAAIGRVQLSKFDKKMEKIDKAMNYFWDNLQELKGITPHRPTRNSGTTMGGWYLPHGLYNKDAIDGLSVAGFVKALRSEGFDSRTHTCLTNPLHKHPIFSDLDIYGDGAPTRIAFAERDVRALDHSLTNTENIRAFTVPPFKDFRKEIIDKYVRVFKRVYGHSKKLKTFDPGYDSIIPNEFGDG